MVILEEKEHTQTQQAMDRQDPRSLNNKGNNRSTTTDRTLRHPRTEAGETTNQTGMILIGLAVHGTEVDSQHTSSNHEPLTAATYHGTLKQRST